MDKNDLLDLISDDDLGLLDIERKSVPATPDDRLAESFMEINEFFFLHNTEPKSGGDIHEHKLASRLKHIRENKEQRESLSQYDKYNLLKTEVKNLDTVSDIFEDDDLELLSIEAGSVFEMKNIPILHRKSAELIARRKPCKDFYKYEQIFVDCHDSLKNGLSKLVDLEKHTQVQAGLFFVLSGLLGYVQKVEDIEINDQNKMNGRLRVIFDNGTESNLLLQSLIRALQKEPGKLVITNIDKNPPVISDTDQETGFIYVLKSLSTDPRISNTKNLFKIGFSSTSVEERIKNAEQDPTYLMAPVSVVATYRCFNMNPQRFERLIHRFFSASCLDLEITDFHGNKIAPKEWFIAPITVIDKAIELIIKGEIVNYCFDKNSESILKIK